MMPYKTNSMSKRSSAQSKQLAQARAKRVQDGGPGVSGLAEQTEQLKTSQSALAYARQALQQTRVELEQEQMHSASLYNTLRVVRRKQQRGVAAKNIALEKVMESMTLVNQLQEENKILENKISELLETSDFSKKQQLKAKKKIRALQMRCKRASEFIDGQLEDAKLSQQTISLMEKGVYTEEARELCRILAGAGCTQTKIGEIIEAVFEVMGIAFEGPRVSSRTVARAILEGGIMSDLQLAKEMSNTEGLTMSGDGTTHRHVNFESRHVHMKVPDYHSDDPSEKKHKSRFIGVDSATDHSSQTQLDGWKKRLNSLQELYNQSPLSHRSEVAFTLADFFAKLKGMCSDHAKDQKKLFALLEETKQFFLQQTLGKERLLEMTTNQFLELLMKVNKKIVTKVGGEQKWNALSETKRLALEADCLSHMVLEIGAEMYSQLEETEKQKVDLFVWTGCAMHKDLNCVKGGNEAMMKWWEMNNIQGPILLANRDNAAVIQQAENIEEPTVAEQRALESSKCGGVKLASLAGLLFNHKDDKVGQQDTYQHFFQSRQQKVPRFPDTSNTRYGSHCAASAALLTWMNLYLEYLEWIRDGKETPGFTNVEKNVYEGLQDVPTQTELAVLTLYAQAISYPYMRYVRGKDVEEINMLDLGPLHSEIQTHLKKIIQDPSILLSSNTTYKLGSLDGKMWNNADAVNAVHKLAPSLPYLQPVLVAFFEGALASWHRFTTEFEEGGSILGLTLSEKDKAWRPPTNDLNEGALGSLRLQLRQKPNMTILQFNALKKFKFNQTSLFVKKEFLSEDFAFVHKMARDMKTGNLEKARKAELIAFKDMQIVERREKRRQKAAKQAKKEALLASLDRMMNVEDVTETMRVVDLDNQLDIYRKLVDDVPLKSKLKNKKMKIEALKGAIRAVEAQDANSDGDEVDSEESQEDV
jgi:hypothetical protein